MRQQKVLNLVFSSKHTQLRDVLVVIQEYYSDLNDYLVDYFLPSISILTNINNNHSLIFIAYRGNCAFL